MSLKGLKVLDLSRILAGPWCTMLLGDMGASVIKLERPTFGDDTRSWGPPFLPPHPEDTIHDAVSTYFLSVNRNKKSIAVDLKHPRGQNICRKLATEWADVIVENFKVGTMEHHGLGYEQLRVLNPKIVYCSITGFGPHGPLSTRPGYDVIISGMYGLMSITGSNKGGPAKVGVAITDILTGTLAQAGILAALLSRNQTGHGQKIDASLMETQLAILANIASSSLNAPPSATPPKLWGTAHESIVPYQAFECRCGGYVLLGAGNNAQFRQLCTVLGLQNLAEDPRFISNANRVSNREVLIPLLSETFQKKTREEWVNILDTQGLPHGPLRTVPEAFACPQALHRDMVMTMRHPVAGEIHLPGRPVKFSGLGGEEEDLPPPMLGQHTEEVLMDVLNLTEGEIANLEEEGIISRWREPYS